MTTKRQRHITTTINIGYQLAVEAIEDDLDDAITEAAASGMNPDFIAGLEHAKSIAIDGPPGDRDDIDLSGDE